MNKVKLGELLRVKRGKSLPGKFYSTTGSLIRLTLGNFDYPDGGFKKNTSKSDLFYLGPVESEFILKKGDLITPLTEQVAGLLGEVAVIPESDLYIQSGDVGLLVPFVDKLDSNFARYLVASCYVKKQLGQAAQQTKIRHTSPEAIENCLVWVPALDEQKYIGRLLAEIDDKIELNKRMMRELEDTARLIYDYWFTQFDFPDENGKPYRSSGGKMVYSKTLEREIPEGWEAVSVNELVHVEKGISYKANDLKGEGVPMVNLASFNTGGTYKAEGLKSYSGAIDSRKTVLPLDLVMCITQQTAIDLSGKTNVIGKTFFVPDIFDNTVVISTDVCKLMVSNEAYAYVLNGLFKRSDIHKYIVGFANGTKIKHLDTSAAFNLRFAVPPNGSDVLECYSVKARLFEKEKSNLLRENLCLGVLRDWLLPMLMNGQVHVD